MKIGEKQLFIKNLEKDLKIKISELKEELEVFETLGGLKRLMQDESKKDEVVAILDKLQTFAEKQLAEEIKIYEEVLLELQKINPNETTGMVA